mmetsp:Transcript_4815/g.8095  ORF Transcript_4815/g.8095 Transcript_4815/m.8095 type:complete len:84 (+) Transcript_4815:230-481(+)
MLAPHTRRAGTSRARRRRDAVPGMGWATRGHGTSSHPGRGLTSARSGLRVRRAVCCHEIVQPIRQHCEQWLPDALLGGSAKSS